jgi:hypothetical protein
MDNAGTGTNRIQAFNSNGFQVGTNAAINASGVLYYYWATAYGTDVFETGSYTGDASNPKTITFGTGTFTPGFANAKSNSSSAAFWATSNMTGGTSFGWAGDADATSSGVATLASGGFTVGGYLNAAATVYYYWAFKGP